MPTNNPAARRRMEASRGRRYKVTDKRALRDARAAAGLTQRAVAVKAGCTEPFYWRLERDGRDVWVSAVLARKIARVLGIGVRGAFAPNTRWVRRPDTAA